MAQIPPIEDAYIDDIIKAIDPYDPSLNKTQGIKLRELIKLMRDRSEQQSGTGGGSVSDATTTTKGILQLAGDLSGTADLPTVPGLTDKLNITEKGAVNGVATLDANGKLTASQTPAIAITDTFVVNSELSMLAITGADRGDVAIRTDISTSFILKQEPASTLGNWEELLTPASDVTSVNGHTGTVTLTKSDIGLSNVDNTTDAAKPVSTAATAALALKANLASPTFTGTVNGITKAMVGLGNVDNTTDAAKPVSTATATALALKANLASPTFTGTPTLPTGTIGVTQTAGNNSTSLATTAFVTTAVSSLISNSSDSFSTKITQIVSLTQAQYNGITPLATTLYIIV